MIDNLSMGSPLAVPRGTLIQADIGDAEALERIFATYNVEAVLHFAGSISVGESMADPAKYYQNNVANSINLLNEMLRYGVRKLVFSSSAAVYAPQVCKLREEHPFGPLSPYGETKLMLEKILRHYDQAYGLKSCALRYFNAAGGDPSRRLKFYQQKPCNLIPLILQNFHVTINGEDYPTADGTCVRDYIHVMDLATAHILALERLLEGGDSACYNLGNGEGFSIRQVIAMVEKVTRLPAQTVSGPRRPGDPPVLLADAEKARRELGWKQNYPSLEEMIEHAWNALAIKYEPSIN